MHQSRQYQNENPSEQFLNNHALQQCINNERDIYINDGHETSQAGEDVIIPHITTRCGLLSKKPDVLVF